MGWVGGVGCDGVGQDRVGRGGESRRVWLG